MVASLMNSKLNLARVLSQVNPQISVLVFSFSKFILEVFSDMFSLHLECWYLGLIREQV